MATLDWVVLVSFLLVVSGVGLWFTKRASGSAENFFVGGRSLPWWLAGTFRSRALLLALHGYAPQRTICR